MPCCGSIASSIEKSQVEDANRAPTTCQAAIGDLSTVEAHNIELSILN